MDAEARREINRRNASKSTGPRSPEGKTRSRRNALKHGLTATVIDPTVDSDDAIDAGDPPPTGRDWLVRQVERVRAQIERAGQIEGRLRDLAAWRAATLWEEDGRAEAEEVGATLRRSPGRSVARLRRSPQGIDWLIDRWRLLARAFEVDGTWTEDQTRLAFDLLGTPEEGRAGDPGGTGRSPLDLARAAIDELEDLRLDVDEADELVQTLAANDLRDTPTPDLARLRRYENALYRRLRWLLDELDRPGSAAGGQPAPGPPPSDVEAEGGVTEGDADVPAAGETNRLADETKRDPTRLSDPEAAGPAPRPAPTRPDLARRARRERKKRRRDRRSA